MSELLGRKAKYSFFDEFEVDMTAAKEAPGIHSPSDQWAPPDHKWSFDSERADWDEFFENHSVELFTLLLFFGIPTFSMLFETNLIEKFWYRVNVQNSITRNVLFLCEPKEAPEHNYYQEYVQKEFINQMYIQIPNTINKMRRDLDAVCKEEQIRRNSGI